jgi:hypothetical protein
MKYGLGRKTTARMSAPFLANILLYWNVICEHCPFAYQCTRIIVNIHCMQCASNLLLCVAGLA